MLDADYLRKQAETCLNWSRNCFDLTTATRLRTMAEEFRAKAAAIEARSNTPSLHPDAPPEANCHDSSRCVPNPGPAIETGGDAA